MVFELYNRNNRRRCILILIICVGLILFQTFYLLVWTSRRLLWKIIIIISRHASTRIIWVQNKCVAAVSTLNRLPFTRWPSVIFHKNEIKKNNKKQSGGSGHSYRKVYNSAVQCPGAILLPLQFFLRPRDTINTYTSTNAHAHIHRWWYIIVLLYHFTSIERIFFNSKKVLKK